MGDRESTMSAAPEADRGPVADPPRPAREAPPETGLLAGADEAGLGPILGPLVVAGVAMAGPRGRDPWTLLSRRVSRNKHVAGRVRVADSKKVKQGRHGLQRLEETVLSFWGALHGSLPVDLGELLTTAGIAVEPLQRCPWYDGLDLRLPLLCDRDVIELSAHTLQRCMADAGIEILHVAVRAVDAEEFNTSIERTDNKSDTHFEAYADVIGGLLARLPGDAHLVADRCGGRVHYHGALQRRLPGRRIRTVSERAGLSTYEVRGPGGDGDEHVVRISFAERGEDRSFPTALASCTAKYVRELMMVMLNDWFAERVPGLARTAGYYVDGSRFLADVGTLLEDAEFPTRRLIRCR